MTHDDFNKVVNELINIAEDADELVVEFEESGCIEAAINNARHLASQAWKQVENFRSLYNNIVTVPA